MEITRNYDDVKQMKKLLRSSIISRSYTSEEGSALVEFLLLAIPLFVPLSLFLASINSASSLNIQAKNLARQAVRAYVTSPSIDLGFSRVQKVVDIYNVEIFKSSISEFEVECSEIPCFKPGSKATVLIRVFDFNRKLRAQAKAQEFFDLWRTS